MVGLVKTMMTADSLQLPAYGPDDDEIRIAEVLPKSRTPHEQESVQRQVAATYALIDALVYELYGLTEEEIGIVEWTEMTRARKEVGRLHGEAQ